MTPRILLPILGLLSLSAPAMAQDFGGVRLAPGINGGPTGLARPLPFVRPPFMSAQDVQSSMAPDSQTQDQNAITALRGDPGFLSGFSFGSPLAASRQPVQSVQSPAWYGHHHHTGQRTPVIINNEGPLAVTVGNGNVVQQQSALGSGPTALQQIASTPSPSARSAGATNLVTGAGNIIQRAPSGGN